MIKNTFGRIININDYLGTRFDIRVICSDPNPN